MFHFFAKIGRKSWAPLVMPSLAMASGLGYFGVNIFGHDVIRKVLTAQSSKSTGAREEISPELKELILTVYNDIQKGFNNPLLQSKYFRFDNSPVVKWFASSLLDPITFGCSEMKPGILIGVPSYYNYSKLEEVPSNIFRIRKMNLFKFSSEEKKPVSEDTPEWVEKEDSNVVYVKRDSQYGQDYVNSLLMSDKAKKFAIARELFIGDSYKPVFASAAILFTSLLSISLSRAAVTRFALEKNHLSQRLPFYFVSGCACLLLYYQLIDVINQRYTKLADDRAMEVSENYVEGAKEYFSKLIMRNKALRNMLEDMKSIYDEQGNLKEPYLLRQKYIPLTERLKAAEKFVRPEPSIRGQ